ncbi:HDOD domain-containing protein [Mariprofundus erugo]|uniref:HDOD domain-containing protein n=1 Tax=Mariprofundus erugo TaxID=2528639 RepID=A0A5R9GSC1_9PROT|nr:HDOD domain-containing protein [Mariprofundus erugo]TLS66952.1 HDOD domain-containing protein [Mariprofundus erugo]TLS77347.1 HDOD domain-containing protein [Mariprofundus erugo]
MSVDSFELAKEIRRRFEAGDARLPVLPEAVIKVRQIVNDQEKGAADIARVLASDTTFSTTVLRIANSARFRGTGQEVRNLSMAIQRLGGRRTLQLMTAISSQVHLAVKVPELQVLLRESTQHALLVAAAAQHLARLTGSIDPEEGFMGGMLFDVGVAAIICAVPDEIARCNNEQRHELLGQLHREMGGRLLTYWEMPDAFIALASHHGVEADDRPRENLIDVIDAVQFLLAGMGYAPPFDTLPDMDVLHYPPMKRLGLNETHLAAVEVELEDSFQELAGIFS